MEYLVDKIKDISNDIKVIDCKVINSKGSHSVKLWLGIGSKVSFINKKDKDKSKLIKSIIQTIKTKFRKNRGVKSDRNKNFN